MAGKLSEVGCPLNLRAGIALHRSVSLRMDSQLEVSDFVIHEFCCGSETSKNSCISKFYRKINMHLINPELNAIYGRLYQSHLENLSHSPKHALKDLNDWQILTYPSILESEVYTSRAIIVYRIHHLCGELEKARQDLEHCLDLIGPHGKSRPKALCSLADVYCDLDEPYKA